MRVDSSLPTGEAVEWRVFRMQQGTDSIVTCCLSQPEEEGFLSIGDTNTQASRGYLECVKRHLSAQTTHTYAHTYTQGDSRIKLICNKRSKHLSSQVIIMICCATLTKFAGSCVLEITSGPFSANISAILFFQYICHGRQF